MGETIILQIFSMGMQLSAIDPLMSCSLQTWAANTSELEQEAASLSSTLSEAHRTVLDWAKNTMSTLESEKEALETYAARSAHSMHSYPNVLWTESTLLLEAHFA